jgi:hypothetical protein
MTYDITQWLKKQPLWIQEAAVCFQSNKTLSENDITRFVKILKGEIPRTPSLVKFQVTEMATDQVRLQSIGKIKGIDNLKPRNPLEFGNSNLAVIYRRNGSGKSGYARILKKASGKSSELLRYNVYEDAPTAQTCSIKFSIGEHEQTHIWDAKGSKIDALSVIDIFDGSVGELYLRQENVASYMPKEMEICTDLVSICAKVASFLEVEKAKLMPKIPPSSKRFSATEIIRKYHELRYDIKPNDVNALIIFNSNEEQNINALRERLSLADPVSEAKKRRKIKKQIENIKASIENRLPITSKDFIENFRKLLSETIQKRQAVNEGAKVLSDVSKLEGIGQETWKALWEAARTYSTVSAYKSYPFPFTGNNARCVLCHQELSDEAKKRVQDFEAFIQGKLETEAKIAEQKFNKALQGLPNVVSEGDVRTRFQAAELEEALGNEVWAFVEKTNTLVGQLQSRSIPDTGFPDVAPVQNVLQKLAELANNAERKAVQFDADAKAFDR